jgi:hypothetical protein
MDIGLLIMSILAAIVVYQDASKFEENGIKIRPRVWALFTFLCWAITLIVYAVKRPKYLAELNALKLRKQAKVADPSNDNKRPWRGTNNWYK